MPTASLTSRLHSTRGLADIARRWGYGCEIAPADGNPGTEEEDLPIAEGVLSAMELPCGVKFCTTDLVASRDNQRAGIVERSLTIVLLLEGAPTRYRLGAADHVLEAGTAVVVAAADCAKLAGWYRRGDQSRSLVLQALPLDVPDEALADEIHRHLAATTARPLALTSRLRALANELFTASYAGPIARLLAESCALELLARALAGTASQALVGTDLHGRDVKRIRRVQEKLVAELGENHRLCDLARLAGMSVSGLKAKFPLVVGQTVFDFLRDQRLERARHGLEYEGWSVKQAAAFVGYAHPSNFAAAYRRKFGVAPSDAHRH